MQDPLSSFHIECNKLVVSEWLRKNTFKHLLEVGVGDGFLSTLPELSGLEYTGIDESSWFIEHCQANRSAESKKFIVSDFFNFAPDRQFDAVMAVMVWCTMKNPEQGFKKLSEILRPEGKAFITMPNHNKLESWSHMLGEKKGEFTYSHKYGNPKLGSKDIDIEVYSSEKLISAASSYFKCERYFDFGITQKSGGSGVYTAFEFVNN